MIKQQKTRLAPIKLGGLLCGGLVQLYKALFTLTCFYLSGFVNHITPLVAGPGAMNEAEFFQWRSAKLGPRKLRLFKLKLIIMPGKNRNAPLRTWFS